MSTRELRLGRNEINHVLTFLKDQPRDLIGVLMKTKAILNFLLVEFHGLASLVFKTGQLSQL